jgi:hypothetical protein
MADITVTAANVKPGPRAVIAQGIAGATIAAGQAVYLDTAVMKLKLADANGTAAEAAVVGIALNNASTDQPLAYVVEDDDFTPGAAITNGTLYVLSANPGGIAPSADIVAGWRPALLFIGKTGGKATMKIVRTGVAV